MCYVYLDGVAATTASSTVFKRMRPGEAGNNKSECFERGWTLQELLAPQVTKEVEDIAYSMIGLLGVHLTPLYGEGRKAFMRLQQALVGSMLDESIFAWTAPDEGLQCYRGGGSPAWGPRGGKWGLLAPSPDCFRDSGDVVIIESRMVSRRSSGYRWTNEGIQFDLAFRQDKTFMGLSKDKMDFPLNRWRIGGHGKPETILLKVVRTGNRWQRERCHDKLEAKAVAKPGNNRSIGVDQVLTAPMVVPQLEALR